MEGESENREDDVSCQNEWDDWITTSAIRDLSFPANEKLGWRLVDRFAKLPGMHFFAIDCIGSQFERRRSLASSYSYAAFWCSVDPDVVFDVVELRSDNDGLREVLTERWEFLRPVPAIEIASLLLDVLRSREESNDTFMLESLNEVSHRIALLDDDGTSAWLYLSGPEDRRPVADVWVHNRIKAPPTSDIKNYRGGPPPAASGYTDDSFISLDPCSHRWSFIWDSEGEAVVLYRDGPVTFRSLAHAVQMKIETPDGRFFSLTIERYEFPDEELGPTEDNPADDFETGRFLVVGHTFRNSDGQWDASGPTMTTNGLRRLADWLDSLSVGRDSENGIYFTERDLEFTFDDRTKQLRVHASWDFLPPWNDSKETVTIDFPLEQIDLASAVNSIREQLARFPGRPPIDNSTVQCDEPKSR